MNVLFVCTGNTCRSPMAAKILEKKAKEHHIDLQIQSAGIGAVEGFPASEHARSVMKEYGMDDSHTTQRINQRLLDWADLVLTMTIQHKSILIQQYPESIDKIYSLKEFVISQSDWKKQWEKLDQLYTQVELKKQDFYGKHQKEIKKYEEEYQNLLKKLKEVEKKLSSYHQQLHQLLEPDRKEIARIEQTLPSLDVEDPFGADLETYRATAKEIEQAIDKIIQSGKWKG